MNTSESDIRGHVRRLISDLSPLLSSSFLHSRTKLSSLGYTQDRLDELCRALEDAFTVPADWGPLDLEDAIVADFERVVLSSVTAESTALQKRNTVPAQLEGLDPRAHMRADGMR